VDETRTTDYGEVAGYVSVSSDAALWRIKYNTSHPCLVMSQLVTSKRVSIRMKYVVKQCQI